MHNSVYAMRVQYSWLIAYQCHDHQIYTNSIVLHGQHLMWCMHIHKAVLRCLEMSCWFSHKSPQ